MSKNELALELTKLVYDKVILSTRYTDKACKTEEVIAEVYNYFLDHINYSEQ